MIFLVAHSTPPTAILHIEAMRSAKPVIRLSGP
jgi:hypothetical protein